MEKIEYTYKGESVTLEEFLKRLNADDQYPDRGCIKSRLSSTIPNWVEIYRGDQQNGCYEEWYKNGQLRLRGNSKDGLLDGLWEQWYANGQLLARCNYKDNDRDGLYEEWDENGQMKKRCNFKDGKPDGLFELWFEDGQMRERRNYKDGKLNGLDEEWYPNGQLKERCNYKDGKRDGLCEEWDENGLEVGIYYFQCGMPIATGDKALAMVQKEKESVKQLSQKS